MRREGVAVALTLAVCLSSCVEEQLERIAEPADWNVLLFLLDDLGCEQFSIYHDINRWPDSYLENTGSEESPGYAPTPFLEELARDGLRFTGFHAQPSCSPTRASILTGLYPHTHGVGNPIGEEDPWRLDARFQTIGDAIRRSPATQDVTTRCIGKWHLAGEPYKDKEGLLHPIVAGGFDGFVGCMTNLDRFGSTSYTDWFRVELARGASGEPTVVEERAKTNQHSLEHQVEESIAFLKDIEEDERFFALVSFHTGHTPFDLFDPTTEPLDGSGRPSGQPWTASERWHPYSRSYLVPNAKEATVGGKNVVQRRLRAMTSACDSAMRMIVEQGMDEELRARTIVLIVGDNGTVKATFREELDDPPAGLYSRDHTKGTVFEPGIKAPLLVQGALVPERLRGEVETGLVDSVDLYALVLELLGADWKPEDVDAVSPLGMITGDGPCQRLQAFSEEFEPNGAPARQAQSYAKCVRGMQREDGWKLIRVSQDGEFREHLYHLPSDPSEESDRMGEVETPGPTQDAYRDLSRAMDEEIRR